MSIQSLLNEMSPIASSDFTRARNTEVTGDPILYKFTMSASNLHDSLADLYDSKGNKNRAKFHRDLSNRLKTDANQYLH